MRTTTRLIACALTLAPLPAAAQQFQITQYSWSAGQADVVLPETLTHICMTTGFTGKFAGEGELARMIVRKGPDGRDHFVLTGTSGQKELRIMAACAPKTQFKWRPRQNSWFYTPGSPFTAVMCGEDTRQAGGSGGIPMSASFLTAMGGRFGGAGERIYANDGKGKLAISVSACSGWVTGASGAYTGPTGSSVAYLGRNGRIGNSAIAVFMASQLEHGPQMFLYNGQFENSDGWVVPANDALCGIIEVKGKFNGYGERAMLTIQMRDGQPWWRIDGSHQSSNGMTQVSARCVSRDQSTNA